MPIDKINRTLNTINQTASNLSRAKQNANRLTGGSKNIGGLLNRKKADEKKESWVCKCGVTNTAKFCGECGSAPTTCPKCKIRVESKFCQECGTSVGATE